MVLTPLATDVKSNEITEIPALLAHLALADQIVTIDAMGCRRAIAAQIVAQGGDSVISLAGLRSSHKRSFVRRLATTSLRT